MSCILTILFITLMNQIGGNPFLLQQIKLKLNHKFTLYLLVSMNCIRGRVELQKREALGIKIVYKSLINTYTAD